MLRKSPQLTPLRIREVLTRVFTSPDTFRTTVASYKMLTGGQCTLYFPFPERGLWLAAVSSPAASFMVIAGSEESLVPFRATSLTIVVEDINSVEGLLVPLGSVVLQPVTAVPTGFQLRLRHADGLVVEYVQHTSAADPYRISDL